MHSRNIQFKLNCVLITMHTLFGITLVLYLLRVTFHAIHPPPTLVAVLKAKKPVLQKIKGKVINASQWDLLFPTSGAAPDSNKFDVTLLTILLRNICGLTKPGTGWDVMPPTGDVSASADVARIKLFRNQVYGHIASTQLDDATFNTLWQEISQPLNRLGIPQKDIDEIKMAPLSPEEESYIKKLKEWKEREDYILSKLNNIETEVSNLRKTVENFFPSQGKPDEWEPTSCLPDRLPMFTGREDEILNVIANLNDKKRAVVSLHGGPGFGKTAIAIEVSHKLSEENNISVIFSQLTSKNTVDKMILQLCLDVGVNLGEDESPESSLILWLRNIKSNVILVLDNIDNLLENKSSFYEFLRLLRKNSNQHCQIVTTSRTSFKIPDLPTDKVEVDVMDEKECVELLKKQCPIEDDKFLRRLAELCGNIPLAMCIAGSRVDDFEDPDELFQYLEKQPMKTLECPESDQCVNLAIDMSFKRCSDKEQETLIRLSVFEGNIGKNATKAVIEKDILETTDILKKLVSLSLIKEPTKHRYSIHLLIKHFLKDKQKSGNEQTKAERAKAERARKEAMRAEVLMVEYYLELGHQLTIKSYSKDGYKDNREVLKREVSNIQNVLKICCQQENPTSSDISECLAHSKIYTTSARLFSVFVRTITSASIVDEFLQRCANLAKEKKQHAIKINFDCLLVAEERYNTIGKSDEDFISKMEEIKKEFETHYDDLKNDKSLYAHYCHQNGRYLWRKSRSNKGKDALDLQIEARDQLKKSLELRKTLPETPQGKADSIFSLLQLGKICRSIGLTERYLKKPNASKTSFGQAKEYYREAIQLSESDLGGHELTSSCYKHSGDLFLTTEEFKLAEKEYTTAKNMRENLGLDASEKYAFILKNLGGCLIESERADEAIEVLEKACDIVEKLPESAKLQNVWLIRAYASLAIAYDRVHKNSEAVDYANKAMELTGGQQRIIPKFMYNKLLKILKYNKQ